MSFRFFFWTLNAFSLVTDFQSSPCIRLFLGECFCVCLFVCLLVKPLMAGGSYKRK